MAIASAGLQNISIHTLYRGGLMLCLAALVSGCSVMGSDEPQRDSDCSWYRSSCSYEGAYEPGEKDYAEQEAKRLNKAQSVKMRSRSSWW